MNVETDPMFTQLYKVMVFTGQLYETKSNHKDKRTLPENVFGLRYITYVKELLSFRQYSIILDFPLTFIERM